MLNLEGKRVAVLSVNSTRVIRFAGLLRSSPYHAVIVAVVIGAYYANWLFFDHQRSASRGKGEAD